MSFFDELKRRNVIRVGLAYVVAGWVLVQVAEFAFGTFGAPEWVLKSFFVLLVLGFPIVLIVAWAFERTPEGIKRTQEANTSASTASRNSGKFDRLIIGALCLALAVLLIKEFAGNTAPVPVDSVADDRPSIAVLPFVNMSEGNDYFSDGLTEEILNLLAKNPGIRVIGRTSSFAFKGKNEDLRVIGEKLGADHLLEGSIRHSGNALRVTAQLIKADDGTHLWSETYERATADIFEIQDDVSRMIARQLNVRLAPVSRNPTSSLEAYMLYLQALVMYHDRSIWPQEIIPLLDRALALDPGFARAHEMKAVVYWGFDTDAELRILINNSASKALAIDPELVVARLYKAVSSVDWSWPHEFEATDAAISAQPDNYEIVRVHCYDLLMTGYLEEAVRCGQRLIQIEPLSGLGYWRTGRALVAMGRREDARRYFQLAAQNGDLSGYWEMAGQHIAAGEYSEAIEVLEILPSEDSSDPSVVRSIIQATMDMDPVTRREHLLSLADPDGKMNMNGLNKNTLYWLYLSFGYMDDYWAEIKRLDKEKGYAGSPSDYAWSPADDWVQFGMLHHARGFTAHPYFLERARATKMVELWEERGPPDFCAKTDGEWVCN